MPRAEPVADDDADEEATAPDPDASPPRKRHRSSSHRTPKSRSASGGVSEWKDDDDADAPDPPKRGRKWSADDKEPVYFRARDSVWFEPLVFLMVIVVVLVGLYAYTSNWPPMYVVESESMQHGYNDQLGLINTGDLVLAQSIPTADIVPYVVGMQTGYTTYGEFGDVILYHPNDNTGVAPIIHRAIVWLDYDAATGSYSAPELNGLSCGPQGDNNVIYTNTGSANGCGVTGLTQDLILHNVGWQSVTVDISIDSGLLGAHSGFLTMGDNNFAGGQGFPDQMAQLSSLVEPGWIVGVARGMVPWFGAIKLALDGNAGEVPPQSWQYLGVTIVGLILAGLGLHLFLRSRGGDDRGEDGDEETDGRSSGGGGGWFHRRAAEDPAAEDEDEAPKRRKSKARASADADDDEPPAPRRGRPAPKVGRTAPSDAADEDDA